MSNKLNHTEQDGSVVVNRVGATPICLTPLNRIFIVYKGEALFPSLRGTTMVTFDNPNVIVPEDVTAECLRLLRKQRDIREGWLPQEEEDAAWEWS